jgi:hypothetical protein
MFIEGKAPTSLVACACGAEEAFVQKEFFSNESVDTRTGVRSELTARDV